MSIKRYYSNYTGKQIDEAVGAIVDNSVKLEDLTDEVKTYFALAEHIHDYLPLTGGSVTGTVQAQGYELRGTEQERYYQIKVQDNTSNLLLDHDFNINILQHNEFNDEVNILNINKDYGTFTFCEPGIGQYLIIEGAYNGDEANIHSTNNKDLWIGRDNGDNPYLRFTTDFLVIDKDTQFNSSLDVPEIYFMESDKIIGNIKAFEGAMSFHTDSQFDFSSEADGRLMYMSDSQISFFDNGITFENNNNIWLPEYTNFNGDSYSFNNSNGDGIITLADNDIILFNHLTITEEGSNNTIIHLPSSEGIELTFQDESGNYQSTYNFADGTHQSSWNEKFTQPIGITKLYQANAIYSVDDLTLDWTTDDLCLIGRGGGYFNIIASSDERDDRKITYAFDERYVNSYWNHAFNDQTYFYADVKTGLDAGQEFNIQARSGGPSYSEFNIMDDTLYMSATDEDVESYVSNTVDPFGVYTSIQEGAYETYIGISSSGLSISHDNSENNCIISVGGHEGYFDWWDKNDTTTISTTSSSHELSCISNNIGSASQITTAQNISFAISNYTQNQGSALELTSDSCLIEISTPNNHYKKNKWFLDNHQFIWTLDASYYESCPVKMGFYNVSDEFYISNKCLALTDSNNTPYLCGRQFQHQVYFGSYELTSETAAYIDLIDKELYVDSIPVKESLNNLQESLNNLQEKTYTLNNVYGTQWVKLLKVDDTAIASSGILTVNCYSTTNIEGGYQPYNNTVLSLNFIKDETNPWKFIVNNIETISQDRSEDQADGSGASGSGNMSSGGSYGLFHGLTAAKISFETDGAYVVGLFVLPEVILQDQQIFITMKLENDINLSYLTELTPSYGYYQENVLLPGYGNLGYSRLVVTVENNTLQEITKNTLAARWLTDIGKYYFIYINPTEENQYVISLQYDGWPSNRDLWVKTPQTTLNLERQGMVTTTAKQIWWTSNEWDAIDSFEILDWQLTNEYTHEPLEKSEILVNGQEPQFPLRIKPSDIITTNLQWSEAPHVTLTWTIGNITYWVNWETWVEIDSEVKYNQSGCTVQAYPIHETTEPVLLKAPSKNFLTQEEFQDESRWIQNRISITDVNSIPTNAYEVGYSTLNLGLNDTSFCINHIVPNARYTNGQWFSLDRPVWDPMGTCYINGNIGYKKLMLANLDAQRYPLPYWWLSSNFYIKAGYQINEDMNQEIDLYVRMVHWTEEQEIFTWTNKTNAMTIYSIKNGDIPLSGDLLFRDLECTDVCGIINDCIKCVNGVVTYMSDADGNEFPYDNDFIEFNLDSDEVYGPKGIYMGGWNQAIKSLSYQPIRNVKIKPYYHDDYYQLPFIIIQSIDEINNIEFGNNCHHITLLGYNFKNIKFGDSVHHVYINTLSSESIFKDNDYIIHIENNSQDIPIAWWWDENFNMVKYKYHRDDYTWEAI